MRGDATDTDDPLRFEVRSPGIALEAVRGARLRSWTALLGCIGLAGGFSVVYPGAAPLALAASVIAAIALAASRFGGTAHRRRGDVAGAIRVKADAIHVDAGKRRVRYERGDVLDGWLESVDDAHRVVLRMRNGDVLDARVEDPEDGNALLHAVGVAPAQQTFRMRLVSEASAESHRRWFQDALRLVVMSVATVALSTVLAGMASNLARGVAPPLGSVLSLLLTIVLSGYAVRQQLRVLARPLVIVGADGVLIRKLGRKRFIPYAQVGAVESLPNGVLLRAGPPSAAVVLATSPGRPQGEVSEPERARREVLHRRIQDALDGARRDPTATGAELLDRGTRPFAEWSQALARLVRERPGYRRAGLDVDLLKQVVENAGAPAERRIGAALALAGTGDAEQKARVRIAAEACANDKLRVALEQAAEGELEEEQVEEALRAERGA